MLRQPRSSLWPVSLCWFCWHDCIPLHQKKDIHNTDTTILTFFRLPSIVSKVLPAMCLKRIDCTGHFAVLYHPLGLPMFFYIYYTPLVHYIEQRML